MPQNNAQINAIIKTPGGTPIPNAAVILTRNGLTSSSYTNISGIASFLFTANIPSSHLCALVASKSLYEPDATGNFTVSIPSYSNPYITPDTYCNPTIFTKNLVLDYSTTQAYPNSGIVDHQTATSVSTLSSQGFTVYPNPTNSEVRLTVPMVESGVARVRILSMLGATVFETTQRLQAGEQAMNLNLQNLSGGMYTVEVQVGSLRFTQKLMMSK